MSDDERAVALAETTGMTAPEPRVGDIWHRYEAHTRAGMPLGDSDSEFGPSTVELVHVEFRVEGVTPKAVSVSRVWRGGLTGSELRRVRRAARKRLCYPTRREAIESFLARNSAHRTILETRLRHAQDARRLAEDVRLSLNPKQRTEA